MKYPRIHLAVDNCFASKRWTTPTRWLRLAKMIEIKYVEASADNECDPLYMDEKYLNDWIAEVKKREIESGVKVVNLYSGHGTYATLGLAHEDHRVRDRMHRDWLESMVKMAGKLNAGLGFFCHAFSQQLLQLTDDYYAAREELCRRLTDLTLFAANNGVKKIGVEQMYTPHQIPWTIKGAKELLQKIHQASKNNFYITIDTGHQTGQRKFLRPSYGQIKEALRIFREKDRMEGFWIGPRSAHIIFKEIARNHKSKRSIDDVLAEMDKYPYLFAEYEDGDIYEWLEQLGCYSPTIHLQQTDGKSSAHKPFNDENNKDGIIKGDEILRAIKKSYEIKHKDMPRKVEDIYLTLEIFAGTAELPADIVYKLKDSVAYWRQFVPQDGKKLNELI